MTGITGRPRRLKAGTNVVPQDALQTGKADPAVGCTFNDNWIPKIRKPNKSTKSTERF